MKEMFKTFFIVLTALFVFGCDATDSSDADSADEDKDLSEAGGLEIAEVQTDSDDISNVYVSIERSSLSGAETFVVIPYSATSTDGIVADTASESPTYLLQVDGADYTASTTPTEESEEETSTFFKSSAKSKNKVLSYGDTDTFYYALDPGGHPDEMVTVNATVRETSTYFVLAVDDADYERLEDNDEDDDLETNLDTIREALEEIIFPRMHVFFPRTLDESELSLATSQTQDDKVAILFTSELDDTVKFHWQDLHAYDQSTNPTSNSQMILFSDLPDSTFTVSEILVSIIYKYQNMINYVEKKLGSSLAIPKAEVTWLDEGLSLLAADLVGYGDYNFSYISSYLNGTNNYVIAGSTDSDAQKGGAYLFLRYLFEKEDGATYSETAEESINGGGVDFVNSLITTEQRGIELIETVTYEDFEDLLAKFFTVLVLDGTSLNSVYSFDAEVPDAITGFTRGIKIKNDDGTANSRTVEGSEISLTPPSPSSIPSSAASMTLKPSGAIFYSFTPTGASFLVKLTTDDDYLPGIVVVRTE